jgi:hypothetical protein
MAYHLPHNKGGWLRSSIELFLHTCFLYDHLQLEFQGEDVFSHASIYSPSLTTTLSQLYLDQTRSCEEETLSLSFPCGANAGKSILDMSMLNA